MTATEKCTACRRRHPLCACNDEPESADAAELVRLRAIESGAVAMLRRIDNDRSGRALYAADVALELRDILAGRGPKP